MLIRNQHEPALLLGVVMREGWNGLALGKALDAETAKINDSLPLGMTLTKVTDQSVNIRSSVDEFMIKFFVALLVVMVVCFVSMGWRVGVVAAAVPLTLAVVFVVMEAAGINFDRVTLGSLILALGLLVDDAIIAIEMMVVKMEEGYDRIKASAYARSHTAAPMLAGTLGDGDWLYAEWVCPVDRRGIHQQYVLDCRPRPDCLMVCGGGVHAVSGVKILPAIPKVEGAMPPSITRLAITAFASCLAALSPESGAWPGPWSPFSFWPCSAWGW